jgi:hypothetical protein
MSANRVIQTGANNQLGGLKEGFFRVAYQVGIAGVVKTEPIKPAAWQMTMLATSCAISISLFFSIAAPPMLSNVLALPSSYSKSPFI